MKLKKVGVILLAVSLMTGILSGYGNDNNTPTNSDNSSDQNSGDENNSGNSVVELTFYNADSQEDPWTDPVAQELTKKTGVKLKTDYPVGSDTQRIALMITEQKFPDMIYAKGDAGSLIDAGTLIDMTDLIEQYGPNIKKLYGDEFDKLKYSEEDPSIYQLSSYAKGGTSYKNSGTAQVQ